MNQSRSHLRDKRAVEIPAAAPSDAYMALSIGAFIQVPRRFAVPGSAGAEFFAGNLDAVIAVAAFPWIPIMGEKDSEE
jgi:hypothetical protein